MLNTLTKYGFLLIVLFLVLVYFQGAQGIIKDGGSVLSNIIATLQGRKSDGTVVDYAK